MTVLGSTVATRTASAEDMLAEHDQSAEDRLHAVHEQAAHARAMLEKRHALEARQAREHARHNLYAMAAYIVLAVSLGIGMQQGWLSTSLFSLVKPQDPALEKFAQTRAGQLLEIWGTALERFGDLRPSKGHDVHGDALITAGLGSHHPPDRGGDHDRCHRVRRRSRRPRADDAVAASTGVRSVQR